MPDHLAEYGRRWQELHPDWEYWLWSDDDLKWLRNRHIYDAWPLLAPRNQGQFRSNIARLEILWEHGGIYADCDMVPLRPIDPLIEGLDAFTSWHRPPGHPRPQLITNGLMGCVPQHRTFDALIRGIPSSIMRNRGLRSTHTTGVVYITKELRRLKLTKTLTVFPARHFYPYQPDEIGTVDPDADFVDLYGSWSAHHWNNIRSGGHTGRRA